MYSDSWRDGDVGRSIPAPTKSLGSVEELRDGGLVAIRSRREVRNIRTVTCCAASRQGRAHALEEGRLSLYRPRSVCRDYVAEESRA